MTHSAASKPILSPQQEEIRKEWDNKLTDFIPTLDAQITPETKEAVVVMCQMLYAKGIQDGMLKIMPNLSSDQIDAIWFGAGSTSSLTLN